MKSITTIVLWLALIALWMWAVLFAWQLAGHEPNDVEEPSRRAPARDSETTTVDRRPVSISEPEAAPSGLPALDFDGYLERLVAIGVRLQRAVERDDQSEAGEINASAESVLLELGNRIPNADEKALHRLTSLPTTNATTRQRVRRHVLLRILGDGLDGRWHRHDVLGHPRRGLDALVTAMLLAIPANATTARDVGLGLLNDRPLLGAAHEAMVLDLVEQAATTGFLTPIASALLVTLWSNLERSGARTAASTASLALLFKDDANPGRRRAALEHLLTADNGHFRDLVVQQVLAVKDPQLARVIAHAAASKLAPRDALEVLRQLNPVGQQRLSTAFMLLGSRDARVLARAYENTLADGITPQLRAELITGIGFEAAGADLDLVGTAFEQDPDPEVRARAMFVLAGCGDAELGERVLTAALDDPRHAEDARWIGLVAMALRNLATNGSTNALARIGRRVLSHPALRADDRAELESLLAEHLPGGGR